MSLKFNEMDRPSMHNHIESHVHKVVSILKKEKPLTDALLNCINTVREDTYKMNPESIEELEKRTISEYNESDYVKPLFEAIKHAYANVKDINKFRGVLFEELLKSIYSRKYNQPGDQFKMGCSVFIKDRIHTYEAESKIKKTLDIAGHDRKKVNLDLLEAKLSPKSIDLISVGYMHELNDKMDSIDDFDQRNIGFASSDSKNKIDRQVKNFLKALSIMETSLFYFSKEDLINGIEDL